MKILLITIATLSLAACDLRLVDPKPASVPCNYHSGDTIHLASTDTILRIRFCAH